MSGAIAEQPSQYAAEAREDESVVLFDVPWSTYVMLRDTFDESRPSVRLTYLEGMLEIMSPSPAHELDKTIIARLLEAYAEERDLRFDGKGSTTFRDELVASGAEPDECYSLSAAAPEDTPDIVLEVVRPRWKVDKLDVYRGLGVPEVWVFRRGRFDVHVLGEGGYAPRERSERLPDLDLARLATYVRHGEDQTQLVKAWRAELRSETVAKSDGCGSAEGTSRSEVCFSFAQRRRGAEADQGHWLARRVMPSFIRAAPKFNSRLTRMPASFM